MSKELIRKCSTFDIELIRTRHARPKSGWVIELSSENCDKDANSPQTVLGHVTADIFLHFRMRIDFSVDRDRAKLNIQWQMSIRIAHRWPFFLPRVCHRICFIFPSTRILFPSRSRVIFIEKQIDTLHEFCGESFTTPEWSKCAS